MDASDLGDCFYGLAQMAEYLDQLTEIHDAAYFQCIKLAAGEVR